MSDPAKEARREYQREYMKKYRQDPKNKKKQREQEARYWEKKALELESPEKRC